MVWEDARIHVCVGRLRQVRLGTWQPPSLLLWKIGGPQKSLLSVALNCPRRKASGQDVL